MLFSLQQVPPLCFSSYGNNSIEHKIPAGLAQRVRKPDTPAPRAMTQNKQRQWNDSVAQPVCALAEELRSAIDAPQSSNVVQLAAIRPASLAICDGASPYTKLAQWTLDTREMAGHHDYWRRPYWHYILDAGKPSRCGGSHQKKKKKKQKKKKKKDEKEIAEGTQRQHVKANSCFFIFGEAYVWTPFHVWRNPIFQRSQQSLK